jgi:thiamine biosynthesis lipoprotein
VHVDDYAGTITRPPGVRIDSGGLAKGLAADLAAEILAGYPIYCVLCDGDLRAGGTAGLARSVSVLQPGSSDGDVPLVLELADGGVATSGVNARSWRTATGEAAHHLIDPRTGRPANTGITQVTALAPTAVEAEIRAKAALLSGVDAAAGHLPHGGVLITADGVIVQIPNPATH